MSTTTLSNASEIEGNPGAWGVTGVLCWKTGENPCPSHVVAGIRQLAPPAPFEHLKKSASSAESFHDFSFIAHFNKTIDGFHDRNGKSSEAPRPVQYSQDFTLVLGLGSGFWWLPDDAVI